MTAPAPPPLRMLFWESTTRCNLACTHCRRLSTNPTADELTTDEVKAVFTSTARLGPPVVVFSGGEPLLRNDWPELATFAHEQKLPIAMATNGTLIDAKLAKQIAEANFRRVSVSLDGANAETHDALRGEGNFQRSLAGVKHLRAERVRVQFNVTVTRANAGQLDALVTLASGYGAEAMHLFMLVPVGCGAQLAPTQQLAPPDYLRVLEWVCDHQSDTGMELRATCGPQVVRVAKKNGVSLSQSRGCLCGKSVAFVSHRGEVFPCGYLPVRCGSVRETSLEAIWRTSDVFADLRDENKRKGLCGDCHFKHCGGCRARAYAATGDYLAEDASCPFGNG
jgi:radical SAM protein with 4Fe4S-binding SPASM domain